MQKVRVGFVEEVCRNFMEDIQYDLPISRRLAILFKHLFYGPEPLTQETKEYLSLFDNLVKVRNIFSFYFTPEGLIKFEAVRQDPDGWASAARRINTAFSSLLQFVEKHPRFQKDCYSQLIKAQMTSD